MDACLNSQDCSDARQDKILSPVSRQVLDKAVVVKIEESDFGTWYCKVQVSPSACCYLGSETEIFEFFTIDEAVSFLKCNQKRISQIELHIH